MSYEVQFEVGSTAYVVRGPDTTGVLELIERLQGLAAPVLPDVFTAGVQVTPLPEINGWIDWAGGDCPVPFRTPVEVRHRNGGELEARAGRGAAKSWSHQGFSGDIVAYRICE